MKENRFTIIAFLLPVAILVILLLLGLKETDWRQTYDIKSKSPYALKVFYNLLDDFYEQKKIIQIKGPLNEDLSKLDSTKKYTYFFVGVAPTFNRSEAKALEKFVTKGNDVFMSLQNIFVWDTSYTNNIKNNPDSINNDTLFNLFSLTTKPIYDSLADYNFTNPGLKNKENYRLYSVAKADTIEYVYFQYFDPKTYAKNPHVIAGYIDEPDQANFIIIPCGKGHFYFHCSPEMFTNISLKDKKRLEYIEKVISHVPKGTLIWDELHKQTSFADYREKATIEKGPLSYILSQRSLRWGWYIGLSGVILFLIFGAKRKQNIIPVIEPKNNTSLAYVKTIGQLYFQEKDHKLMVNEIKLQFFNFIKNRYLLTISKDEDEKFIQQLHLKSGIDHDKITNIITEITTANYADYPVDSEKLKQIFDLTEEFYKNCK